MEPETVEMKEEWYLQSMVRPRECIDRMMTVLHKAMHAFAKKLWGQSLDNTDVRNAVKLLFRMVRDGGRGTATMEISEMLENYLA